MILFILCSGQVIYSELRRLRKTLKLFPDVSNLEKQLSPYIYLNEVNRDVNHVSSVKGS